MSRSAAYRRIESGVVPACTERDGVITIARRDVRLIQSREPAAGDGRKAVMLRPDLGRYAAWERAAGDQLVSVWLAKLADIAAGVL